MLHECIFGFETNHKGGCSHPLSTGTEVEREALHATADVVGVNDVGSSVPRPVADTSQGI